MICVAGFAWHGGVLSTGVQRVRLEKLSPQPLGVLADHVAKAFDYPCHWKGSYKPNIEA